MLSRADGGIFGARSADVLWRCTYASSTVVALISCTVVLNPRTVDEAGGSSAVNSLL